MKNKISIAIFVTAVCIIAVFNVSIVLKTNTSYDLTMLSIEAISDGENFGDGGENDFPTDPFPGSGIKAAEKITRNYFEYFYIQLYENCYAKYKTPVTEIYCPGMGEVQCSQGFYAGASEYVGVVENYGG